MKGVSVESYDDSDAIAFSEMVCELFPEKGERHEARKKRCMDCLGVTEAPGGTSCPGTTDWHIAGQARGRKWILITDDRGEEFQGVARKATLAQLQEVLNSRLQDLAE
ncbi:MAG: hypothetical protein AB7S38_11885 [Vulcanimicrobiota bacterium]